MTTTTQVQPNINQENPMQHPAFQSKAQLVAMKRDDLLAHYALWLDAVNGAKLAVTFGADRKNTKAVIADRIIALQVKSDPLAQDTPSVSPHDHGHFDTDGTYHESAGLAQAKEIITNGGTLVLDEVTSKVATTGTHASSPVVRRTTAADPDGTGKLIPKFAPRSKCAGMRDAMIRLYQSRPDFLPAHLRKPFGCIG